MTRDKAYYLEIFQKKPLEVFSGQEFTIRQFQPGDEYGIARLIHAVYGEDYPIDEYYIPGRILEKNREQSLCSVIAQTADGNIAGHCALYRSAPPFLLLYEGGLYMILENYRQTDMFKNLDSYLKKHVVQTSPAEGIFVESVTNQIVTQFSANRFKMSDYALELCAFSPEKIRDGEERRVSNLIQFKTVRERIHPVYLPDCYQNEIDFLLRDADFKRYYNPSVKPLPSEGKTRHEGIIFANAGLARFIFYELGSDFDKIIDEWERRALEDGCVSLQAFFNLACESVGAAIKLLQSRGWMLGGYLPRWFDSDGFLMQKILKPIDFDAIKLCSRKAKEFLKLLQNDYERCRKIQVCS